MKQFTAEVSCIGTNASIQMIDRYNETTCGTDSYIMSPFIHFSVCMLMYVCLSCGYTTK